MDGFELLFTDYARHAWSDGAEDFVGDGSSPVGMIVGGDALTVLFAKDDDLISGRGVWDVGDIDYGQVHGHAAHDWGDAPVDEHMTTGGGIGSG